MFRFLAKPVPPRMVQIMLHVCWSGELRRHSTLSTCFWHGRVVVALEMHTATPTSQQGSSIYVHIYVCPYTSIGMCVSKHIYGYTQLNTMTPMPLCEIYTQIQIDAKRISPRRVRMMFEVTTCTLCMPMPDTVSVLSAKPT